MNEVERLMYDREPGEMPSPLEFREAFDADIAGRKISISSNMQWTAIGTIALVWAVFLLVSVGGLLFCVINSHG